MKDSRCQRYRMDKKTILKIANLAKIEIDDSKANEIKTNLEKILNLVDEMNQVDTENIEPMSHPLNLKQYLRDDEVTENNKRDLFQENNKDTADWYYKVPKIID